MPRRICVSTKYVPIETRSDTDVIYLCSGGDPGRFKDSSMVHDLNCTD